MSHKFYKLYKFVNYYDLFKKDRYVYITANNLGIAKRSVVWVPGKTRAPHKVGAANQTRTQPFLIRPPKNSGCVYKHHF